MFLFTPTFILRHRRENLKKCSLRGLENRPDIRFFTYPKHSLPDLSGHVLLTLEAPPLSILDQYLGLLLIDSSWRYAATMYKQLPQPHLFQTRSLPRELRTAYPRRQEDCTEPDRGLASIEALYCAYRILERDTTGLLDQYYWEEEFLKKNFEGLQGLTY